MTACRNKARGAVVAALAGALTLGAAPVMALADGASLMATTDAQSINSGTIASFEGGLENGATFVANGDKQGLVPATVQPWPATVDVVDADADYVIYKIVSASDANARLSTDPASDSMTQKRTIDGKAFYFDKAFDGDGKLENDLPSQIGDYAVFAKVDGTSVYAGAKFSIVAADLDDATFYEVKDDATDLSDEEFTFNNTWWSTTPGSTTTELGIKIGDTKLNPSEFDVQWYDSEDKPMSGTPIAAGSYSAVITGVSGVYAGQKGTLELNIAALDLSQASVVIPDVAKEETGVNKPDLSKVTVNGVAFNTWPKAYMTVAYTNLPTGTGEATLTIEPNEEALKHDGLEGSITKSASTTYSVVEHEVNTAATYDGKYFYTYSTASPLKVDYSANPTNAFDASKVKVTYTDPDTNETVETDKYELRVTDADGNVGGVEMLGETGTYTVVAVLDAEGLNYDFCGESNPMTVTVTKGVITSADVAFTYKGEVTTGLTGGDAIDYLPGYDALDDISIAVRTTNGKEVPASDYDVVVTNSDNEVVDSMENADEGSYTITVKPKGYTGDGVGNAFQGNTLKVTVNKRALSAGNVDIRVKNTFNYTDGDKVDHRVLQYTGEELTAAYEWTCDGGETWYDLPADDVDVSYKLGSKDAVLKEVGTYDATIAAKADSTNYKGTDNSTDVEVSDAVVFADVPQGEYYTQAVYDANKQGYVFGMGGTNLFMPNKSMSRAEMTVMLYRMAGGVTDNDWEASETETAYLDRYSDVDATEFYAKALAWATQAGVVRGYEDGTFGPNDDVTVEQYVTMLARYAEVKGDYEAVDADEVLGTVADGSQVSEFGQDAVAWAVENDYLAQGGADIQPQSPVTRGRAVTIAVRYQPTKASIVGNRG